MREGTTSRLMAADRPYGEFYDFYSVSLEYIEYTLVYLLLRAGCEINVLILINLGTSTYICPTYLIILTVKGDISPSI
jgi:hypothetical protein